MPYLRTINSYHQYLSIGLCILTLWLPACVRAIPEPIIVNIIDDVPYHAHPPGQPFKIALEVRKTSTHNVTFHWRTFRGTMLTKPANLLLTQTNIIQSPSSEAGYYELVIQPEHADYILPNREPGEERAYGFVILPTIPLAERRAKRESQFGVVHANMEDPYLPTWIKTMTWNTTGARWWDQEMRERRDVGKLELPIIVGSQWDTDDSESISKSQLKDLFTRVSAYFSASPSTLFWETGIEENLKSRYDQRYYWQNLEQKLRVVREAVNNINPDIKLIYQIAELKPKAVISFLNSPASRFIDILSLHPYAWPDFPSPDTWHDNYIQQVQQLLNERKLEMPIWYTEVGAAHHGSSAGSFFGYPEKNASVTGLTRQNAVSYMIKLHVMALHTGVGKIFWYNYQDRDKEREYAENHFGLRDYWGHPKPAYAAYVQLHRLLDSTAADGTKKLPGGVRAYQFSDRNTQVLVLWMHPSATTGKQLSISALLPKLSPDHDVKIIDAVGATLPSPNNSIFLTSEPVFIVTTNSGSLSTSITPPAQSKNNEERNRP